MNRGLARWLSQVSFICAAQRLQLHPASDGSSVKACGWKGGRKEAGRPTVPLPPFTDKKTDGRLQRE